MDAPTTGPEELARRSGFKPWGELNPGQQKSVDDYCQKWYLAPLDASLYWWKESSIGDNNWISFNIRPITRIAAPHLRDNR